MPYNPTIQSASIVDSTSCECFPAKESHNIAKEFNPKAVSFDPISLIVHCTSAAELSAVCWSLIGGKTTKIISKLDDLTCK